MADYYVRPGGSNSNDGSTYALAFQTINYAATQMSADDVLIVEGDTTYTMTASVPMWLRGTIKALEVPGDTKPVLDFDGVGTTGGGNGSGILIDGDGAVTVQGLRIINCEERGIYFNNACQGSTVYDCEIHNCELAGFDMNANTTGNITARFVRSTFNGLSGAGDGINQRGAAVLNAYDCYTEGHDQGSGVSDGFSSHDTGSMNCYRCIAVDDEDGFHMTASGDHILNDCISMPTSSGDGIKTGTGGGSLTLNRCQVYQKGVNGVVADGGGSITAYNSFIVVAAVDTGSSQGFHSTSSGGALNTYNCAVFDISTTPGSDFRSFRYENAASSAAIYNCISYVSGTHFHIRDPDSIVVEDNNCFYPDAGSSRFRRGATNYNFAGWQTASSQGANSITSDPLCYYVEDRIPNFRMARLRNGSPCIGAGKTNIGGFTTDAYSQIRGTWDIGPVRYSRSQNGKGQASLASMLETTS